MEGEQTYHKGINLGKLFLGFLLVFAGLVYFAREAGFLPMYGGMHWTQLWPVVLIFSGLSLIRIRGFVGVVLGLAFTILILGITAYAMFRGQYQPMHRMMFDFKDDIKKELPWFSDRPCGQDGISDDDDWRIFRYQQ
jgi:hypothetical protein